ncbi:hypothetical protein MS3_00003292 [Schistosoma haematobium]|uniref:Uncharacterized protein n=1 Tax=Schistosoma haematobium TaxID=6185 RepID=A0A6A5DDX3_SCHHA|nr:hypothetical protein MS3_00003292 [Schistosoma haematobium]KAH9590722.1 hypothetical protein MS3_00003292 [Schistosoma haematobium]
MSGKNSHIISESDVRSEPSVSTCLPDRKTSFITNTMQNVLKYSHSLFQSLDHSGPSVPTMLAYVDFRPWFKGWDQLDVNDQDKLKDLMTRNEQQFEQRSHRPKRALSKTSDDNVLGISWKEEQELRKAMYVSLRDQQQTNSDSSPCNHLMTLRFQLVKQPSISGPSSAKLGLAKPRSTIQFKHSRKQIRPKFVSANTIFPKTRNASESSPNKEVLKCDSNSNKTNVESTDDNHKPYVVNTSQNTSHICLRNLYHRRNPTNHININNQLIDNDANKQTLSSSAETFEVNNLSSNSVSTNYSRRPTLMTASNYLKSNSTNANSTQRKSVIRKSPNSSTLRNSSFRSENIDTFATCSSPKKSIHSFKRRSKQLISSVSQILPITEPDDNTPKCFSNLYCESDFQLLSKSPYEPWQDDIGRLASVHDFINFVCFHDCSATGDPNTEWFASPYNMQSLPVPRTLQSNLGTSNSDHNNKKCPKNPNISTQRKSYESANLHRIINNVANRQSVKCSPVTRSTSLCVAKKLASIQPSPAVYSSKSRISSPLKMGAPDNCFLFDGYKICVEENESSSTTLISSAASFQTSKLKVILNFFILYEYRFNL